MENVEEKRRLFPKEYAHVEEWVVNAQTEIIRMEKEIQKLSGENWQQPAPAPKGPPPIDHEQYRQKVIDDYKRQIMQKGKDTMDRIRPELANTDPRLAKKMMEKTAHLLDKDNHLKDASAEKMAAEKTALKDIDRSSVFVASVQFDRPTYFADKPEGNPKSTYMDRSNFSQAEKVAEKWDVNKEDLLPKGNSPDFDR